MGAHGRCSLCKSSLVNTAGVLGEGRSRCLMCILLNELEYVCMPALCIYSLLNAAFIPFYVWSATQRASDLPAASRVGRVFITDEPESTLAFPRYQFHCSGNAMSVRRLSPGVRCDSSAVSTSSRSCRPCERPMTELRCEASF